MQRNATADGIHKAVKDEYDKQNRILAFDEYLELVRQSPRQHTRSSAQYLLDVFDHFGREENGRFRVFDQEFSDTRFRLIGQEAVQQDIYQILQSFVREGMNNKLILLHGPNGSAKSSIIACIMRGIEEYSSRPEGVVYRFHWVFPADRFGKPSLGLGSNGSDKDDKMESFANLPDIDIAARISCELRDHPLFLVPQKQRASLLKELNLPKDFILSEYIQKGDLSQKSKRIFEALLRSYKGDYKKVLRHVQVERFYVSKRYRNGAVTIEPQMHVDATAQQVTMDKSVTMLPSSLHFLSLFDLGGDLVDGNRGIIEYNDLLKRPIDTFKYLLTTTETGTVSIGGTTAFIDSILIGTCNEAQLDAFKEYPDFPSFKARIELVRVPYLLDYRREADIYRTQVRRMAGDRHVAPHVLESASRWAVLCRLKKPNASHYPGNFAYLVNSLTPVEKARLYADESMPLRLSSEEKKVLKSHLDDIRMEYATVPYYEGRIGPSPREMKIILFNALERNDKNILSPIGLFEELEDFIKRTSEYDYLREDIVDGYHDSKNFIQTVRDMYLDELDREVRNSLGIHDDKQYEAFLKKYVQHVTAYLKKEKIKNPVTGQSENPDKFLMEEFESKVNVTEDKDGYRQNILTQLGVYALENPAANRDGVDYSKVFPELMRKVRDSYVVEHTALMKRVYDAITLSEQKNTPGGSRAAEQLEAEKLTKTIIENMNARYGYNDISAREAFVYLFQKRY